ncbi:MAG: hypothetical protein V1720_10540 [bacterium]
MSFENILGILTKNNEFSLEQTQRDAWLEEIKILKSVLILYSGSIYIEYSIPRMGQRIDTVVIIGSVIFTFEFKIGESEYTSSAVDQVMDYALDLKNFHETSHDHFIAPILISTKAKDIFSHISLTPHNDKLLFPIKSNVNLLSKVLENV